MPTILIAEDTADSREMFKWMLEQSGYTVVIAEDGEIALEIVQQNPPDLLLTDLMMPGKSGVQLIQEVRSLTNDLANIPIIAISAFGIEELHQAMAAGANAILRKPNDLESIVDTVRNLLSRSSSATSGMP